MSACSFVVLSMWLVAHCYRWRLSTQRAHHPEMCEAPLLRHRVCSKLQALRVPPLRVAVALVFAVAVGCATDLSSEELAAEYYNLANGFLELEDYDSAALYYERSLRLAPNAQAQFNLVLALVESGRSGLALAQLDRLATSEPDNVLVLELRAMALHRAGRDTEALSVYQSITELQPENDVAPYNRALLLWALGQTELATVLLRQLVERRPADEDALYNLALILTETDELADAAATWRRYLEGAPTDVAGLLAFAQVQSRTQRYGDALDTYAAAEALLPPDDARVSQVLFERAAILLTKVEDPRAGLAALRAAFEGGYHDRRRVAELLAQPVLLDRDLVVAEVEEHNLQPRESDGDELTPAAANG